MAVTTFYDAVSTTLRSFYDRRIVTPPILDCDRYFPDHVVFSKNWRGIRDECLQLMRDMALVPHFHEVMPEQKPLSEHGSKYWRLLVLRAYGVDHPGNQAKCPFTAALFRDNKAIRSVAISFLEGKKHIPMHRGPFRGVLRYHLGLVIPRNADGSSTNRLSIDGVPHDLCEGKGLLWDDTYLHEAWNDSESVRAVLLVDIVRPDMPWLLTALNNAILFLLRLWIAIKYPKSWNLPRNFFRRF
ncbi:MAG: aspartyl/asparaginyl beta-hydroxylase domain-containing protein [Betaproteobacteria bacterium]|jgi:aspartate beta-hydroxylase